MKTFLQRMAIPLILKREHVLCAAQTGNFCFWWQLLILRVTKCSISEDFPPMVTKSSRRKKLYRRLSSFNFHKIVSPAHANTTQTATLNLRLLNTNCYSSVKQIYPKRQLKNRNQGLLFLQRGRNLAWVPHKQIAKHGFVARKARKRRSLIIS